MISYPGVETVDVDGQGARFNEERIYRYETFTVREYYLDGARVGPRDTLDVNGPRVVVEDPPKEREEE